MGELNRLVSAYLDLAENRARRKQVMTMADWASFLELSDYEVLCDKGCSSAEAARIRTHGEYEEFRAVQDRDYVSDFDREVQRLQSQEQK